MLEAYINCMAGSLANAGHERGSKFIHAKNLRAAYTTTKCPNFDITVKDVAYWLRSILPIRYSVYGSTE